MCNLISKLECGEKSDKELIGFFPVDVQYNEIIKTLDLRKDFATFDKLMQRKDTYN